MGEKLVLLMILIVVATVLVIASNLRIISASPYVDVDVETAYNMIVNGSCPDLVVLDVRNQSEYDSGHIYGAVWIPHTELEARISELAGQEDHEIIVYCRSGVRSVNASETLDSSNFTKLYNMLGGILAWESGGYPVWIATVHNLNTTFSYDTIQAAINAPQTLEGHTIFVEEGIYYEHVVVDKSISLVGENRSNTIIDGMHKGDVVHISADNVVVSKFAIINSKNQGGYAGINSYNIKHCSIRENNILSNWRGIWLYNCTNCIIQGNSILNTTESLAIWIHYANSTVISSNIVTNNPSGVYLYYSDNNVVRRNIITDNDYYGLTLTESKGNLIIENVIANNSEWDGVALWDSCHNTVTANSILNNPHGLRFGFSSNNTIYHNNFINNAVQAYDTYREYDSEPSINSWDDGHPSGGNYWSDYVGLDLDHDAIGDSDYPIDVNNTDHFPLMSMFSDFSATSEYHVQTICNSTISNFQYNDTAILFNVTGEKDTAGFCRICIPTALMNNTYKIFVNGTEVTHMPLPCSNSTHTYLYFTYHHSTQEVVIIEEFPSLVILPLFMITTLLAVTIYRRKHTI